jgi:hypothetical protein
MNNTNVKTNAELAKLTFKENPHIATNAPRRSIFGKSKIAPPKKNFKK